MPIHRLILPRLIVAAAMLVLFALAGGTPAVASFKDRHAGYYYPNPVTKEVYNSQGRTIKGANRNSRLAFITGVTSEQLKRRYPPQSAMFAKGTNADKLILVSLREDYMGTLHRARGVLAILTSLARTTPIFREFEVEDQFNFLDLLKMLGFRQLTVSDGKTYSHQFEIR